MHSGDWRRRADAKGNYAPSLSGVIVDTEKMMSSVFCWLAPGREGFRARKTSHQTALSRKIKEATE